MLEHDGARQAIGEILDRLECKVELPSSREEFFEPTGRLPTIPGDRRRYPRHYLRAVAALQCRQTFAALPRPAAWHKVYTKDISRCGLAFLHSQQLFPRERMRIILPDGQPRIIEVLRCRRIQERCYEIGARMVEDFREHAAAAGSPS